MNELLNDEVANKAAEAQLKAALGCKLAEHEKLMDVISELTAQVGHALQSTCSPVHIYKRACRQV